MRASAGNGRGVLVAPDDIAVVSVTAGCRARMRASSCPAYPVAPAIATRAVRGGALERFRVDEAAVAIIKYDEVGYIYTDDCIISQELMYATRARPHCEAHRRVRAR